jgi:integrase
MHQLWQHPNGNYYVLYGPRLQKRVSTRTGDRREAETFLAQFIAGSAAPTIAKATVGEILAGYEADKKANGIRGRDALKYCVISLSKPLGPLQPNQLLPPVIRQYAKDRQASPGTILRDIGVLRAALAWAVEHQWIEAFPVIKNPVKTPKSRDRWATKEEARRLIEAAREPHIKAFIMLGFMTAARVGAIIELRWEQVNFATGLIDYGEGHGNKRRAVVPINSELVPVLTALRELACTPYVIERHGKQVQEIKNGFKAACRRAGVKGITPHIMRHSAATWMAMDGVPLREIARLIGDDEATVERVYAKHSPDYLKRAVSALQLTPRVA